MREEVAGETAPQVCRLRKLWPRGCPNGLRELWSVGEARAALDLIVARNANQPLAQMCALPGVQDVRAFGEPDLSRGRARD